ncbi:hypothetical protein WELLINGTON_208 [Erwinia phage Wellington]|uniref:Uncharacterized protein n=1 Tax=Erwinia phage Wellington TaxID=2267653 RepID=A0A345BLL5_9CAUD|nr:hypothetical protein HOT70_gp093 [Erwinia phage Wellington]AXF51336.1 hypothetical protein WELLINGTON_208 [Erwinia phage Wellington]
MPKETLSKLHDVAIPLYGINLLVAVCPDAAREFDPYMDLHPDCSAEVYVFHHGERRHAYIGVVFENVNAADANTVAHEAVHAAWRTLEWVGIKATVDNQEALAYLVGWVAQEITDFVTPHRKAKRKKK